MGIRGDSPTYLSLALQLDALNKEGCEKIFQEKAFGAQRDRPELKAALAYRAIRWWSGKLIDLPSMKQLIETNESFQDRGIGLKSVQDPIDTSSPSGKLVFHIFAALAEFERGVIRERATAGLRAARERGRVGGRPPALSAKDLQAAKAMLKDSDITVAAVARRLNVAASTLYRHIPRARSASLETDAGRRYTDIGMMNRFGKPDSRLLAHMDSAAVPAMSFACLLQGMCGRVEKGAMNSLAPGFTAAGRSFQQLPPIIPGLHPVCDVHPMHRYHLSPALLQVRMPVQQHCRAHPNIPLPRC